MDSQNIVTYTALFPYILTQVINYLDTMTIGPELFKQVSIRPYRSRVYQRLYTAFLSEGLIFAYQQPQYKVNKNQQWQRNNSIIIPLYKSNQNAVY